MIKGVDISEHNGTIDFEKLVKTDIKFIMIRVGYGKNNIDEQFERNIKMCNQLNIPCGVYWFSYAYTPDMAKQEALYCLTAIKKYRVEYPVVFDFEYDSVKYAKDNNAIISKALATQMVNTFCETIEQNKYYPMYYSNIDYLNNMFNASQINYEIWLAHWNIDKPDKSCGIWQYTDRGQLEGINNSFDLNSSSKDYSVYIKEKGYNNLLQVSVETLTSVKAERDLYKQKYTIIMNELNTLLQKYGVK